ncbi:MAG: MFS transporter, partial [Dongiaceae bacterium]
FDEAEFAGCFAVLMALAIGILLLLQLIRIPPPTEAERRERGRPLGEILRQPVLVVAVLCGMIGYSVMSLVMTATPLAMVGHHHGFDDAAFVIQWHVLGMFIPAFFTGHLIARYGTLHVMLGGAVLLAACVGINLAGARVIEFWTALLALGVGWSFLYIGASTLLTESYRPAERATVQAFNDFMIGVAVSLASFSSGALHSRFGWEAVNYGVAPLILAAIVEMLWLLQFRRRRVRPGVPAA